jgi:hypothetical protein
MVIPNATLVVAPSSSLPPNEAIVDPILRPLGIGTLLTVAYGIAFGIGTTQGHVLGLALAVPVTIATSIAVSIPSLFVVLAMLKAPIELLELLRAASSAYRYSGVALGGIAPTLLLLSTSIDDRWFVYQAGCCGLLLGTSLGAYRMLSDTRSTLIKFTGATKARYVFVLLGFIGLSFEIAARIWSFTFSFFGGMS